ncbi:MAG: hypothetical protein AAGA91_18970 [Pseudomonadota bacterium]
MKTIKMYGQVIESNALKTTGHCPPSKMTDTEWTSAMGITRRACLLAVALCVACFISGCSDKGTTTELAPEKAFDPATDLFLAFYDNKPDPDDIHS